METTFLKPQSRRPLTAAELAFYKEHGYLIVKGALLASDFAAMKADLRALVEAQTRAWVASGMLPAAELSSLLLLPFETRLAAVVAALRSRDGADSEAVSAEIERFGLSLDTMYARTRGMFDFFFRTRLLDVIQSIVGDEIMLSPIQHLRPYLPAVEVVPSPSDDPAGEQPRMVTPTAGAASLAPWHQDMGVTREEADGTDIVTCWVPLVTATSAMGALKVIPDLHDPDSGKGDGLLEHVKHPQYGTTIRSDLIAPHLATLVDCPCELGDILLMHHFTPHRTGGPNVDESASVRWSLDVRFQKRGTPTGRPFWPEIVVRSASDPDAEQREYDEWCQRWASDLETSVGERWHRVAGDVGGSIGGK